MSGNIEPSPKLRKTEHVSIEEREREMVEQLERENVELTRNNAELTQENDRLWQKLERCESGSHRSCEFREF